MKFYEYQMKNESLFKSYNYSSWEIAEKVWEYWEGLTEEESKEIDEEVVRFEHETDVLREEKEYLERGIGSILSKIKEVKSLEELSDIEDSLQELLC